MDDTRREELTRLWGDETNEEEIRAWREDPTPDDTTETPPAPESAYLLPSDSRLITEADLAGMDQQQVALARNEIYARHGYVFKTDKWSSYFNARSWYTPNYNYSESLLTDVERANIDTIVKYEKSMGWK